MWQIRQKLIIVTLVSSIFAQSSIACDDIVRTCDAALEARKKEVSLCRLALRQSMDRSAMLELEVENQNKKLGSFTRNPFIMATIGIVTGFVVTGLVLRK